MKKQIVAGLAFAVLLSGVSAPALAQYSDGSRFGHLSGTLGVVSDYRFRGISHTDEGPAVQGSVDWSHDNGVYLGVWGSNVDWRSAWAEFDIYGGYVFTAGEYEIDLGAVAYWYPGSDSNLDYNFFEVKAAASRSWRGVDTRVSVNYSPEYFRDSGAATYAQANFSAPIADTGLRFNGKAGYQWVRDNAAFGAPDYADWSLGVGYTLHGFDLGLDYVDTSISKNRCRDNCDATAVLSISRALN